MHCILHTHDGNNPTHKMKKEKRKLVVDRRVSVMEKPKSQALILGFGPQWDGMAYEKAMQEEESGQGLHRLFASVAVV